MKSKESRQKNVKSRKQKHRSKNDRQAKAKQGHRASKQSYFQNVVKSERSRLQGRRSKLEISRHAGASFGEALRRTAEG